MTGLATCPGDEGLVTPCVKRTYTTGFIALLTVGLAAAPASAGGLLPIASPAFGTSCANHGASKTSGTTTHGTGAAEGPALPSSL